MEKMLRSFRCGMNVAKLAMTQAQSDDGQENIMVRVPYKNFFLVLHPSYTSIYDLIRPCNFSVFALSQMQKRDQPATA